MRVKDPHRHRPFQAPGGLLTPVLGICFCAYLMLGLGGLSWVRFGVWLVVGLAIYLLYGSKKSVLRDAHLPHLG